MTRPRAASTADCLRCRVRIFDDPEAMQQVTLHRMEHRRQDRRRAQWRSYKQRRREQGNVAGFLHSLACRGKHYGNVKGCRPIPVYWRREEAA
jgi:hypothetical protein